MNIVLFLHRWEFLKYLLFVLCLASISIRKVYCDTTNRVVLGQYEPSIQHVEGLSVIECLHVANELTSFRINGEVYSRYEKPNNLSTENYSIDLGILNNTTRIKTVTTILEQDRRMKVTPSESGIQVVWRDALNRNDNPLNRQISKFVVEEGDIISIFEKLRLLIPEVYLQHPVSIGGKPEPIITESERQQFGGKKLSLDLTNVTVRTILNRIVEAQPSSYWISEFDTDVKPPSVRVSFYAKTEHKGKSVIAGHDPVVQEWMQRLFEESEKPREP